jgi:hypothetical protein
LRLVSEENSRKDTSVWMRSYGQTVGRCYLSTFRIDVSTFYWS